MENRESIAFEEKVRINTIAFKVVKLESTLGS